MGNIPWDHEMFNEPDQGYFVLPTFLECGFHIRYSKGLVLAPTAKSADGYRWVGLVTDLIPEFFRNSERQIIKIV
jgi:hypothetical protein